MNHRTGLSLPTINKMGHLRAEQRFAPAKRNLGLAAVLLVAALVRFVGLFAHPTIPDEAFTFFIAAHQLPAIVALLKAGDFHPPLIYAIGHGLFAFTTHAYAFRIVCAVVGVAGVAASYAIARRLIPSWALLATLLVAINPPLVFYDGFFRMYALLWALSMISWALLFWALDHATAWPAWVAFSACTVALLYTQYLAFFAVFAQVIYVLIFFRRTAGYWIAVGVAVACFVPWLPVFAIQYPLGGSAYGALHGHWEQLLSLPGILLADGLPLPFETSPIVATVLICLIVGGGVVAFVQRRWLALALATPLVLQMAYSIASGKLLFGQRYLLQAIPPIIFLAVIFLAWLRSTRLRALSTGLVAALVALAVAGTADKHFLSRYRPVDWTEYRKFLDSHVQPGDAVVFDGAMVYYVLVGSKADNARAIFLIARQDDAHVFAAQAARLPRVWYIDYQSELPDPQHVVFDSLMRTHPKRVSWQSTDSGYGDVVLTTLFLAPGPGRKP